MCHVCKWNLNYNADLRRHKSHFTTGLKLLPFVNVLEVTDFSQTVNAWKSLATLNWLATYQFITHQHTNLSMPSTLQSSHTTFVLHKNAVIYIPMTKHKETSSPWIYHKAIQWKTVDFDVISKFITSHFKVPFSYARCRGAHFSILAHC